MTNNNKNSCNCGNDESKIKAEETKSSCCCSDKEESKTDSCCSTQPKQAQENSCCSTQPKQAQENSCCSTQPKQAQENSCCSTQPKQAQENSCCSTQPKQAQENSCCSTQPKQTQTSSCCSVSGGTSSCCHDDAPPKDNFWGKYKNWIRIPLSLIALVLSYVFTKVDAPALHKGVWHYFDFGMIAVLFCGIPIFIAAAKRLYKGKGFKGKVTSSLLVSTAILACILLEALLLSNLIESDGHDHSYMFAAGEVAFLVCVGGILEARTIKKARAGIEGLAKLTPLMAKYMIDGVIVEKPLSEVRVGDLVTILPDDMISVDGVIAEGFTSVDESIMTGESLPVDKNVGDNVFGGTYNKGGAFTVRVTKPENAMAITKLKRLVEEAEGQKAPISGLAEKAASVIVPSAIVLSFVIFGLNMLFMGQSALFADSLIGAIERGVTMLVVFCPCALVLATPTAIAAGLGNAARNGILIKSGATLEELGRVKSVAFDKTGTLTQGAMFVDSVLAVDGIDTTYLEKRAAAAESFSTHPIAKAVSSLHPGLNADSIKSITGFGIEATVEGNKVVVAKYFDQTSNNGNKNYMVTDHKIISKATQLLSQGKTVISIFENDKLIGIISLSDKVREESILCIKELEDMGVSSYMLTGDNKSAAGHIASQAGIRADNVFSALLPQEKLKKIEELKSIESVCMVGDGVNDAPALALANCSLAMGAMGSDTAIEAASAALMNSDLKKIPFILRLGRKVLRTVKFNIILSMSINFAAVLLSTFGVINPAWGALIHNISSLLVVLNSAFLLKTK